MKNFKQATIEDLKATLAINLRRIRLERGLAQEKLALEANVDRTFDSKIERQIGNPSLEILLRLANRLEVPISILIQVED